MSKDLHLQQGPDHATLRQSVFRPRFEDSELEAAWEVGRLGTFKRVNRRGLLVLLFACLVFCVMDLLVVGSGVEVMALRIGSVLLVGGFYVSVDKVDNIRKGDGLIVVATAMMFPLIWFQIFMRLPVPLVEAYWMATLAITTVLIFVLLETMLWIRIGLSALVVLVGLTAPLALGLSVEETLVAEAHVIIIFAIGWVAAWQVEIARRLAFARQIGVEQERERTVGLLRNILPVPIADRLLSDPGTIAERHSDVTVLFADIVGFTPWASACEAEQVVEVLDQIFSAFDHLCDEHGVEKIKTIGDAYMAAGGVPSGADGSVARVVDVALSMLKIVAEMPVQEGTSLQLRIGVHRGPVVAGVIGRRKFIYDLWGDTVNTAARMESHGVAGRVQVTEVVADELGDAFVVEPRGVIEIKGKGPMTAFLVERRS